MAKKILILESSATMQKLFTKMLDSKEYSIKFIILLIYNIFSHSDHMEVGSLVQ